MRGDGTPLALGAVVLLSAVAALRSPSRRGARDWLGDQQRERAARIAAKNPEPGWYANLEGKYGTVWQEILDVFSPDNGSEGAMTVVETRSKWRDLAMLPNLAGTNYRLGEAWEYKAYGYVRDVRPDAPTNAEVVLVSSLEMLQQRAEALERARREIAKHDARRLARRPVQRVAAP